MKKIFSYENFWTRNLLVFSFFYVIILVQEYAGRNDRSIEHFSTIELFFLFFPLYGMILFHNLVIVKNLLFKKKYSIYLFASIAFLFALAVYFYFYSCTLNDHTSFLNDLSVAFFAILIGATPFFIHTWIVDNTIKTKKQLITREAELNFLKNQISPHFLFNALNNLYGTSLAAPEIISEKILELSELLRYQIESTKIDTIAIKNEIEFIDNYLKYIQFKSNNLTTSHSIEGEALNIEMPPLLVLPLIENAVKYSSETENPTIDIKWLLMDSYIKFEIKNSYLAYKSKIMGTKTGLDNLRKRLEILSIKYALYTQSTNQNTYHIVLEIWK